MQTLGRAHVAVDHVTNHADIAELAKYAVQSGFELRMAPTPQEGFSGQRLDLTSLADDRLTKLIARLVFLDALTHDRPYPDVLKEVESELERWHATKKRPSDSRGLGAGHADDE